MPALAGAMWLMDILQTTCCLVTVLSVNLCQQEGYARYTFISLFVTYLSTQTFSTGFRHTTQVCFILHPSSVISHGSPQSTDERFELTSSRSRTSKIRPDDMESSIGYGIAITKVVERSKDPLPRSDSMDSS